MSFAYKWRGDKKPTVRLLPDYPLYKRDRKNDRELVKDLWRVLNEADIVIAHNGDRFDIRKTQARFIYHGLNPTSPFKSIDTLKVVRRHFKLDSNRLNDAGPYLGLGAKLAHEERLQIRCVEGDEKAWGIMGRYNARDVDLLEAFYDKIRPYITNHPALTHYTGRFEDCPSCQSANVVARGWNMNRTGRKRRMNCQDCGSWFSGPQEKRDGSSRNGSRSSQDRGSLRG